MRSVILIILSSVFINGATELHQLFKLPFLLEHYRHHKQEDKSLTLVDFLRIHYTKNHPADNDDNEDNELPFKSDGNITHLDIPLVTIKEVTEKIFTPSSGKILSAYPEGILSHKSFSVFHPPRLS